MAEKKVDSTTDVDDSPVKTSQKRKRFSPKNSDKPPKKTSVNHSKKAARIASAKKRAKDIFDVPSYELDSESEDDFVDNTTKAQNTRSNYH